MAISPATTTSRTSAHEPPFRVLDLPPEIRLMILLEAVTLPDRLHYTCPHVHDDDYDESVNELMCDHIDDDMGTCDHAVVRLSYIPHEGRYMFWLPIIANRQIYGESAEMVARRNTIVFTHSTLECCREMEFRSRYAKGEIQRLPASEEIRSLEVALDFTWTADLANTLSLFPNVRELTFVGTKPWLREEMLPDFRLLLERLPKLRSCKIVLAKERVDSCSHCGTRECAIWLIQLFRSNFTADSINIELARALPRREESVRRRAARQEAETWAVAL